MKNRVAVITGASSGIGKSLAYEFASKNYHITIAARREEELLVIQKDITEHFNLNVLVVKVDVTNEQDCKYLIDKTIKFFGRMDVLINNAGISMLSLLENADTEVIKRIMDVNFFGMVYCTKHAIKHIITTKGSIVGISSIAGYLGLPSRTGYSASKFAMHGFLEAVRTENYDKGIHVLIACPGFTQSNIRKKQLIHDGTLLQDFAKDEDKMMTSAQVAKRIYLAVIKRKPSLVLTLEGRLAVFMKKVAPNFLTKQVFRKFKAEKNM